MRTLRRLVVATTIATYLLVTVGGLVRATGSGLGCPDWPRCHGRLVPPLEYHAIIEYSHRLVASVVIGLTIAVAVAGFRARHQVSRRAVLLAVATVPVVFSQAVLGAVVVALHLDAESVVAHLLVAMTLLAVLIALLGEIAPVKVDAGRSSPDRRFARSATAVAGAALVLMLLGSYVSGRGAGLAFTGWPLFDGRLIPARHGVLPDLHFAHRVLAAVVAVAVFALARQARRRPQAPAVAVLVRAAAALIGIEILVGAGNVWTRLSAATRTTHLALGALIWGALFGAARLAWRLPTGSPATPGASHLSAPGPKTRRPRASDPATDCTASAPR